MPLTRIVPPGLLAVALGFAVGCGAASNPSTGASGKSGTQSPGKYDGFNDKTKSAAADFLKAVKDGKATPAQLTAEFKKAYAPAELDADKAQGYSDVAAAQLLKSAATEVGDDPKLISADGQFALFAAVSKGGERTLLRVAADGKIDWLSVGPKGLPDSQFKGDGDAAQFAAMAFLDAAFTRKFHLAEGLLSAAGKAALGTSVVDKKYDFGALEIRLKELFGGATQYTVTVATKDTVTANVGGKTATVKLSVGRSPADMKVDAVEVK